MNIEASYFGFILYQDTYENTPDLPTEIREVLQREYELRLVFLAPKKDTPITVYTPRKSPNTLNRVSSASWTSR